MSDALNHRYVVGIDLGTTNSAVSFVDLAAGPDPEPGKSGRIRPFPIPQLAGPGEFRDGAVLPSFLYIPGPYDLDPEAIRHPWKRDAPAFVGAFARDHGSGMPSRLVASAKSWLCHDGADRRAKILPWGADREVDKVSPVAATAAYLNHIRQAWNHRRGDDEESWLEHQFVTLTVPASFDEVARDLTLEAAAMAGLKGVTLLEEPLAAFYSWLDAHESSWRNVVSPGELILVCDVGGGTTDFTLITLREVDGHPRFERIAVGDHLILGGDNIDLTLARHVESRMGKGKTRPSLSPDRWKSLCHQCRQAKEALLGGGSERFKVTLVGKGKQLIAGTLSADLTAAEARDIVLEGFFPLVRRDAPQAPGRRKGITEFGLPYESEPAITRHMGWFLERHAEDVRRVTGRESPLPDLILFNGGSLKSAVVRERIREAVRHWFGITDQRLPREMDNPDPDLAVGLGAAYYGLVKAGRGVRVGSGSPRSYYLGVALEGRDPDHRHALCLVERGLEEGSAISLADRQFDVLANQPVRFDLYSSSFRSGDRAGDLVGIDDTLTALPPLQTVIQFGRKGTQTHIPVRVDAEYTEAGTLALWCGSAVSEHRWRLQFQLRGAADLNGGAEVADTEILDEELVARVRDRVRGVFAEGGDGDGEGLMRDIATLVEKPRQDWPLGLIRRITDELLDAAERRGASASIESRWLNLTGFCLRPGLGDGFDDRRVKRLWKFYKAGPLFGRPQNRSDWWIMWRRVAGGLTPGQQRQFLQDVTPLVFSNKGPRVTPQERLEIWMAVANLERLSTRDKIAWGQRLLEEMAGRNLRPQHFWCLGRMGAREPLYGPVDRVIPRSEAESWIHWILDREWPDPSPVALALSRLARKTGDLSRDVSGPVASLVIDWLATHAGGGEELTEPVRTVVAPRRGDHAEMFGESLPLGIRLRS